MQDKIRGIARIAEELGREKYFVFFLNANEIIIMDVCNSSSIKKHD
jgi:hypothetical protein